VILWRLKNRRIDTSVVYAGLTLNRSAACRRDDPAATSATALARKSSDRALPMSASESEAPTIHEKRNPNPDHIRFISAGPML